MQNAGVMQLLRPLLLDNVPSIQQTAALALGRLANCSDDLAEAVVANDILPQLVYSLGEQNRFYKKAAAFVLRAVAKHSPELAQSIVDAGAVAYLAPLISHDDSKLKRQVCSALAQVAKHSVDLAEVVVEAEIFPRMLAGLKDLDVYVRKNAATCVREVVKHTPELAKLVVSAGGAAALVDFVRETSSTVRLPGIMALGYIAAFSEAMALAIIVGKGVGALKDALVNEREDHIKAATVWTLGQVGRHTPDHAKALAEGGVFSPMVVLFGRDDSSDDLKLKCKRALKGVLVKCTDAQALAPLLRESSAKIQKYVLAQYAAILPNDPHARRAFMQTGLLQRVQEIKASAEPKVLESIARINNCFPEDAVKFSDPLYAKELLNRLDE